MKKLLGCLGMMALMAHSAAAFRPAGWVFSNYPWAYDSGSGDWYWFSTADRQWILNTGNGQWATLPNSAMASGWVFYRSPYAYAHGNGAWHWINAANTQWVVNMRTRVWSRLGTPSGMAFIPGGTNVGTNPLAKWESYEDWYPQNYSLTVSSFYMDKYEVTKALWNEVYTWARAHGYNFAWPSSPDSGTAANHPITGVTWQDAVKWCNARSQKEGRPAVYTVDGAVYKTFQGNNNIVQSAAAGYRLPTAAEWEYAARGGLASRRYPWGDTISHSQANYYSDSDDTYDTGPTSGYHPAYNDGTQPYTSPVGSFAANGFGLHDMTGNVSEWCFPYDAALGCVVSGGNWNRSGFQCRIGIISRGENGESYIGFRTVLPRGQ